MLIAVVLGYLAATMFLIAGVSRAVTVCMNLHQGVRFDTMMDKLMEPSLLVAVSVVLLLLIQIATFIERIMYSQLRQEKRRVMDGTAVDAKPEKVAAPVPAPVRAEAPAAAPSGEAAAAADVPPAS